MNRCWVANLYLPIFYMMIQRICLIESIFHRNMTKHIEFFNSYSGIGMFDMVKIENCQCQINYRIASKQATTISSCTVLHIYSIGRWFCNRKMCWHTCCALVSIHWLSFSHITSNFALRIKCKINPNWTERKE